MPRKCEGLPTGPCPHNRSGDSVKLCQGDLLLCHECENARFSTSTSRTNVNPESNGQPNESLHTPETTDQNNVVIVDALLSYIIFSLQNSSAENFKNADLTSQKIKSYVLRISYHWRENEKKRLCQ